MSGARTLCLFLVAGLCVGCGERSESAPVDEGMFELLEGRGAAATDDYASGDIVINEVRASGVDWVELTNISDDAVDVSGYRVTLADAQGAPDMAMALEIEQGDAAFVEPGGHLFIYAAGPAATSGWKSTCGSGTSSRVKCPHASWTLDEDTGFVVFVLEPQGEVVVQLTYPPGLTPADRAWGRIPDGTGAFAVTMPTPSYHNAPDLLQWEMPAPLESESPIVLNEATPSPSSGSDWVELYNRSEVEVDVTGWVLRDDNDDNFAVLPLGSILASGGFLIVQKDAGLGQAGFDFGLSKDDAARLYAPSGHLVDTLDWHSGEAPTSRSFGRYPDGMGVPEELSLATKGEANAIPSSALPPVEEAEVLDADLGDADAQSSTDAPDIGPFDAFDEAHGSAE
jgi:hypothetical protein